MIAEEITGTYREITSALDPEELEAFNARVDAAHSAMRLQTLAELESEMESLRSRLAAAEAERDRLLAEKQHGR